jgi:hypothetical protein
VGSDGQNAVVEEEENLVRSEESWRSETREAGNASFASWAGSRMAKIGASRTIVSLSESDKRYE